MFDSVGKPPTTLGDGQYGFIQFDKKDLDVSTIYELVTQKYDNWFTQWQQRINADLLASSSVTHHHDPEDDDTVEKCPTCGSDL